MVELHQDIFETRLRSVSHDDVVRAGAKHSHQSCRMSGFASV